MIVAIDGPSGAGKSTVAKAAAKRLGFSCLDTGAMYRAIAWKALADGVSFDDAEALGAIAQLVNDGVINASLAVMDDNQCYELIANDQCGMFFGSWWGGQWPVVSIMGSRPDDVEFKPLLVMANPETGKFDVCGKNPTNTFIVVRKGCSEDVKEAVKFAEGFSDAKEGD